MPSTNGKDKGLPEAMAESYTLQCWIMLWSVELTVFPFILPLVKVRRSRGERAGLGVQSPNLDMVPPSKQPLPGHLPFLGLSLFVKDQN